MLLAGLTMFVVWIAAEILLEHVISQFFLGKTTSEMWAQAVEVRGWSGLNAAVNIGVAVLNCTILIWLYASLRPMYGVGTKTALIASVFGISWMLLLFINAANLGLIPIRLAAMEAFFEALEFPIAMLVGAGVYEGREHDESVTA
jgi:hypothetical protein